MAEPAADPSRPDFWRRRYREGRAGWDLGGPCPVFVELLDGPWAPPPGARVAVPGCGAGHDVRLFRERGYDAVGFDFAAPVSEDPPIRRLDVFELGRAHPEGFDAIVEYTCYCAIDPRRRAEYAASLRAALRPAGLLIALLFPVEERAGGPPFGIREEEVHTVLGEELELLHLETPRGSVPGRRGRERLAIYRKPSSTST